MAFTTNQPAQMTGLNGYKVKPVITIGETIPGASGNYTPPGILDGIGAFELEEDTVRVLVNHELRSGVGYAYALANGTELTGARVSYFDIDKETLEVVDAGLAYDTIINRNGEVVDEISDLEFGGLNRLCSSHYIEANQFESGSGIVDEIYFTGEETFGGTEFALDVATNTLHAVPWLGRAAWENITQVDTGDADEVGILVGDDREAAPLLLYVGEKDTTEEAGFLERNGLAGGSLYVWVPDAELGDTPDSVVDNEGNPEDPDTNPDPAGFNGTGNSESGKFVEIDYYRSDLAGTAEDTDGDGSIQDELGYDEMGFATQTQQDLLAEEAGAFQFSRPEDVATNPADGTEAVLASTGRSGRFPDDVWGTTYSVDIEFSDSEIAADLTIIYDGDDAGDGQFDGPDFGVRSPDNLDWADDGYIYINEDRSTGEFGDTSGEEASIWKLDPTTGELIRVAQMDRSAVPGEPIPQTDGDPDDIGDWESSGILDVSSLFDQEPGELFLFDVQAHSLRDGVIAEENLVQGGQLAFLQEIPEPSENASNEDDLLIGLQDNDVIAGLLGNDEIYGLGGDDVLRGDANSRSPGTSEDGNDTIFGGQGDDRIGGKGGDDQLYGDEGEDSIWGDDGDDLIRGGLGDDVLTGDNFSGGQGSDTFILAVGEGTDTIVDFEVGTDFIGLAEGLTFADLSFTGNSIISGEETLAILNGIDTTTLTESDFMSV
ncbi:hypothetical protein [Dapis sp. BLCC M229]|uniref:hypothetical protein n=1 Tax=Dapis sp. BLCC M229 TaxID=3400188 RepID=UPI003CF30E41